MNLEALKEKARRHEQKEEWKKAQDAYWEVIQKQDKDEPPDITLFNRLGDIQTRLGRLDAAVKNYEKAIDLYLEAELPTNAIAICKKVIRNLPEQSIFFLRMGQIRGAQGFLTDAKQNFLNYAERTTAVGDMDSALDALVELVDLVPDDVEIRMGLASQLESHDRIEEGVTQYTEAYRHLLIQDRKDEAEALSAKIAELDPDAVLPDAQSVMSALEDDSEGASTSGGSGLGGFELGSGVQADHPEGPSGLEESLDDPETKDAETGHGFGEEAEEGETSALPTLGFGEASGGPEDQDPLPTFGLGEEEDDDEEVDFGPSGLGDEFEDEEEQAEPLPPTGEKDDEAGSLPSFGADEGELAEAASVFGEMNQNQAAEVLSLLEPDAEEDAEALPFLQEKPKTGEVQAGSSKVGEHVADALEDQAFEGGIDDKESTVEIPIRREPASAHSDAADRGDLDLAIQLVRAEIGERPDEADLYQRQVEYAFRKAEDEALVDAYLDLASHLLRTGSAQKARAVFQQVLSISPGNTDASAGVREIDGVGADAPPAQVASSEEYVDLGAMILGDEGEKTTRWQVTADSPTGDDQADFAKMLNQFKEKVSENVDADDISAHHDLGTAYLEMGLLDEAIGEFQMALRASPDHLPTHEVMGRCWMEKGEPDMAVRALNRALDANFDVEDELIGIYYIMGLAKEDLGNVEEAVEFYEKVFSLDINFKDVTERLRDLR